MNFKRRLGAWMNEAAADDAASWAARVSWFYWLQALLFALSAIRFGSGGGSAPAWKAAVVVGCEIALLPLGLLLVANRVRGSSESGVERFFWIYPISFTLSLAAIGPLFWWVLPWGVVLCLRLLGAHLSPESFSVWFLSGRVEAMLGALGSLCFLLSRLWLLGLWASPASQEGDRSTRQNCGNRIAVRGLIPPIVASLWVYVLFLPASLPREEAGELRILAFWTLLLEGLASRLGYRLTRGWMRKSRFQRRWFSEWSLATFAVLLAAAIWEVGVRRRVGLSMSLGLPSHFARLLDSAYRFDYRALTSVLMYFMIRLGAFTFISRRASLRQGAS